MAIKALAIKLLRLAVVVVALCSAGGSAGAEPVFPALSGRVVDEADLLSAADRQQLTAELKALEDKTSDQLVVVTLPSLQGYTIEDFGYQLGRHWGIGTSKRDNGVLLIVAPNERKVRIEVGYGLEPVLTDALTRVIIESAILPRFRTGDFAGGIKDGTQGIVLVLTGDAAEVANRARGRHDADQPAVDWFMILLYLGIFGLVLYLSWSGAISPTGSHGRSAGSSGSRGGWSGGGGRSGGFSGGGGSFGGGGSSGSW